MRVKRYSDPKYDEILKLSGAVKIHVSFYTWPPFVACCVGFLVHGGAQVHIRLTVGRLQHRCSAADFEIIFSSFGE